jgi:hypothetical protein
VLVLILIDTGEDRPAELGPRLLEIARKVVDPKTGLACVLIKVGYETWFFAATESLAKSLNFASSSAPSAAPEEARHGKAWVEQLPSEEVQRDPKSARHDPRNGPGTVSKAMSVFR